MKSIQGLLAQENIEGCLPLDIHLAIADDAVGHPARQVEDGVLVRPDDEHDERGVLWWHLETGIIEKSSETYLTDLVVSMTKTMGGLNGMEGAGLLVGQLLHLQATQRRPGGHNESGFESADRVKRVIKNGFEF